MALISCHECGSQVSTQAKACPKCGAMPQRERFGSVLHNLSWSESFALVLAVALGIWGIRACTTNGKDAVRPVAAVATPQAVPAQALPPSHYYVWKQGDQYGYQRELSEDARKRGIATEPLFVIRPQESRDGQHAFFSVDGGVTTIFKCTEPCEVVETAGTLGPSVLPAPQGSLLWAVVEDARNGELGHRPPIVTTLAARVVAEPAGGAQEGHRVSTNELYAAYRADPEAADAKYGGHRISVSAKIVKTDFVDAGVGHLRTMWAVGGGAGTTDDVALCFTESCSIARTPTVPDDVFRGVKVGDSISATCTLEPSRKDRRPSQRYVDVRLSSCSMNQAGTKDPDKP